MFAPPVRDTKDPESWIVRLRQPVRVDEARFRADASGIEPSMDFVDIFSSLRTRILTELVHNTKLFAKPPTLESLELITPPWGCIRMPSGDVKFNSYTLMSPHTIHGPCFVELVLEALCISRSTIRPMFGVSVCAEPVIDFDWGGGGSSGIGGSAVSNDLEEVSDLDAADSGDVFTLKDPATLAREKAEAKERVRTAYRAAEAAREAADVAAARFYQMYAVSDDESTFSEWTDSEDDE